MSSKSKRTEAIRNWKRKPNKENLKKNQKRMEQNQQVLRDLAAKDAN
jgi:hypothetical protein